MKKSGKATGLSGSPSATKGAMTKVPLRGSGTGSTNQTLSHSKGKTQSQEDLTKPKDRTSTRPKYSAGSTSSSHSSNRRPQTSKESQRPTTDRSSRDKNRPSSATSAGANGKSSGRTSVTSQRRKESVVSNPRVKSDDKVSLEAKIKDLMTAAKGKDSEIKSLKEKVENMNHIIEQRPVSTDSGDDVTSNTSDLLPSPDRLQQSSEITTLLPLTSNLQSSSSPEDLQNLKVENLKLKEQLDAMMLSMRQKTDTEKSLLMLHRQTKHMHGVDTDASSHDGDALESSMEDLASPSMYPSSRGTSHFGSAENLLEVGSNCGGFSRSDDKLPQSSDGSENLSAAAVVCLTEKIHRMEESQISTNEELEATVQELADLQKSVPELVTDNTRLRQEKQYLMQKLCDTEKRLDQKETEVQHLRVLLNDRLRDDPDKPSVEQQYVQLLDEREHLLDIQDETNSRLRNAEQKVKESHAVATALEEQNRKLEREIASITTERNRLDKTIQDFRESGSDRKHSVAIRHLEDSLHHEREKVAELMKKQAILAAGDDAQSSDEVVAMLEQLRTEKHDMEEKYLLAEEDIAQLKEENERLDDRVAELEEELEAAGATTKKDLSELSEVIDHLQEEIRLRDIELENTKEAIFNMEDAVEQNVAVKKHDNHIISKLQAQISTLKEEKICLGKEKNQLEKHQRTQSEEWKQFQTDLQMAVMIANDMKAETQADVARLREENQMLDERITKLQVENGQLRRRRKTTSSINLPDPDQRQRSVENELAALRESWGVSRRYGEQNSPGVQSLIKSFDSHINQVAEQQKTSPPDSPGSPTTPEPRMKKPAMSDESSPFPTASKFSPSKTLAGQKSVQSNPVTNGPVMAEVAPMQRHHSMSSMQQDLPQSALTKISGNVQLQSKPGTPDGKRTSSAADLSQIPALLLSREKRNSSNPESRKQSFESKKPLTDLRLERLSPANAPSSPTPSGAGSTTEGRDSPVHPSVATPPVQIRRRVMSTPGGDSLATLARRYGGSKRNALLKWCQEKTKGYAAIDVTNFSSSWNDGLAFCALVHSHLPAHIPYDTLLQQLVNTTDPKSRIMLQAKNFRLAFAAAESVGIEPSLSVDEMTNNERPDWQRVMRYVTEIYKYFEM